MSDFQTLLGELDTLAKALPQEGDGDAKIQAAANGEEGAPAKKPGEEGYVDPEAGKDPMAKSFQVTLADGTVIEAEDGTELVKSLVDRFDATESVMAKAVSTTLTIIKAQGAALKEQGALIKSLNDKYAALSNEGRGRKTTLTMVEKQVNDMTKSEPQGMTGQEFMAKANLAFDAKKITGVELNTIDVCLRQNHPIDHGLIAKVAG